MKNKNQGEHWKVFALFLEATMQEKGMNRTQLAEKVGVHSSTIKRFFELDFCLKLDVVLKIAEVLGLEVSFTDKN